jgi:hypothetical protein
VIEAGCRVGAGQPLQPVVGAAGDDQAVGDRVRGCRQGASDVAGGKCVADRGNLVGGDWRRRPSANRVRSESRLQDHAPEGLAALQVRVGGRCFGKREGAVDLDPQIPRGHSLEEVGDHRVDPRVLGE